MKTTVNLGLHLYVGSVLDPYKDKMMFVCKPGPFSADAVEAIGLLTDNKTWITSRSDKYQKGQIKDVKLELQVEHVRLGIPYTQPLAVQQWEGLIAVNYAARAAGIARHERISEALRKVGLFSSFECFNYFVFLFILVPSLECTPF